MDRATSFEDLSEPDIAAISYEPGSTAFDPASTPLPTKAHAATPALMDVPLSMIRAVRNPRHIPAHGSSSDAADTLPLDPDLEGLARSLGRREETRLAEPPVVEELPNGTFRLCAGERRVEAARRAGWADIPCLVYPPMDPAQAHTLSLVENIHRAPMHPLEEISALCISRLLANADARGVGEPARAVLEEGWERSSSAYSIIRSLSSLLRNAGWVPERPDVSWKAHLDDLGISMAPWERKRKMRLLNLDPDLQEKLRQLDITEAALRALGTLETDDQRKVVEALILNPSLARKVRRVARARRDGFYSTIEDALAEVQGGARMSPAIDSSISSLGVLETPPGVDPLFYAEASREPGSPFTSQSSATLSSSPGTAKPSRSEPDVASPEVQDAVLQILECADRLAAAMKTIKTNSQDALLPEPWGVWSRDALAFISSLVQAGDEEPSSVL